MYDKLHSPYVINIRVHKEEWNGENRAKCSIIGKPIKLFGCEGGDANQTFKILADMNKNIDRKLNLVNESDLL